MHSNSYNFPFKFFELQSTLIIFPLLSKDKIIFESLNFSDELPINTNFSLSFFKIVSLIIIIPLSKSLPV